jgi:hypothetical protein
MMAIEMRRIQDGDPFCFEVVVREGAGATRHEVTMRQAEFEKLAAHTSTPERCIEAAFRFLLDREPKEAILARFDITLIANYFPEFPREFPSYLASR